MIQLLKKSSKIQVSSFILCHIFHQEKIKNNNNNNFLEKPFSTLLFPFYLVICSSHVMCSSLFIKDLRKVNLWSLLPQTILEFVHYSKREDKILFGRLAVFVTFLNKNLLTVETLQQQTLQKTLFQEVRYYLIRGRKIISTQQIIF